MLNQPKPDDRLDPKGKGFKAHRAHCRWRSLITKPGIKHRPNVAQNGCAEQSNPFDALQTIGAGNQPQAQTGEIAQEAKAPGKARGYADVGTDYRKVKVLADVRSYGRRANSY